jgi:inosine-uridine nucleoside N-ribohydrolase
VPLPILLDVDTGIDDALAILYALRHPDLDVLAISCVSGNAGVEQVVTNTLKVLDAADAPYVPVARGATQPLVERDRPDEGVHGEDGLGGLYLPEPSRSPSGLTAVEMLQRQITASSDPVTLVALAPQTNLAMLLTLYPELTANLDRILFMGGSAGGGNVTAVAEFNVWQDPEAASCVIESPVPATMYGLDVFSRVTVPQPTADMFRSSANTGTRLAGELLYRRRTRSDRSGRDYVGLIGDAGALVYLTNPELFRARTLPVRVNLSGMGRGQTIVDQRPIVPDHAWTEDPWPRIDVVLGVDARAATEAFVKTIDS